MEIQIKDIIKPTFVKVLLTIFFTTLLFMLPQLGNTPFDNILLLIRDTISVPVMVTLIIVNLIGLGGNPFLMSLIISFSYLYIISSIIVTIYNVTSNRKNI